MKTDTNNTKFACIKDMTIFEKYKFTHNHIYNVSYEHNYIFILDDNNNQFEYHIRSGFNEYLKQEYFVELSELRKQKLQKINGSRR